MSGFSRLSCAIPLDLPEGLFAADDCGLAYTCTHHAILYVNATHHTEVYTEQPICALTASVLLSVWANTQLLMMIDGRTQT